MDDGIEICNTSYQSPTWNAPLRLVIIRQKITLRPKATGKVLRLFEDDEIINGYRHSCYITNLTLPPTEVWRLYCGRVVGENQIKELKYDYAADKINQQSFNATETTHYFIMIAYNLMRLFKQVVIQDKVKPTLKTIRFSTLNIGSYLVQNGRDRILKISLHMKRRSWITKLWQNMDNIKFPSSTYRLSSIELFGFNNCQIKFQLIQFNFKRMINKWKKNIFRFFQNIIHYICNLAVNSLFKGWLINYKFLFFFNKWY